MASAIPSMTPSTRPTMTFADTITADTNAVDERVDSSEEMSVKKEVRPIRVTLRAYGFFPSAFRSWMRSRSTGFITRPVARRLRHGTGTRMINLAGGKKQAVFPEPVYRAVRPIHRRERHQPLKNAWPCCGPVREVSLCNEESRAGRAGKRPSRAPLTGTD